MRGAAFPRICCPERLNASGADSTLPPTSRGAASDWRLCKPWPSRMAVTPMRATGPRAVQTSRSRCRGVSRPQAVTGAANRLDRLDAERAVDLVTQIADVYVDDIRAVLVVHVPSALQQVQARQDLTRPAHEHLQQLELLRRQH